MKRFPLYILYFIFELGLKNKFYIFKFYFIFDLAGKKLLDSKNTPLIFDRIYKKNLPPSKNCRLLLVKWNDKYMSRSKSQKYFISGRVSND
jgi:hypothetical protein